MAFVQTAYADGIRAGLPGMKANSEDWNAITRTASASIGFGLPVIAVAGHKCILATQETFEAVAAAVAGNTGNGTMGSVTVSAGAKEGVYKLTIVEPGSNVGGFIVEDPDGINIGTGDVAAAFSAGGLAFTLADGGTDFAVGDQFTITLTPSTETADLDILGISLRDSSLDVSNADLYVADDNVAILERGVVFVTAGATVAERALAYWNPATSRYTATTTHLPVIVNGRHARFDEAGVDGSVIKLAIR